ncbi:MFS transporter [Halalkalicoccus sp. NIPERK01]|uniref:MFS transporter n=1 Tax=Halalkalicoccus sp. NIPERK01 TaxID=3053469 RepID=UPI00256EF542|nr:MFS transporter [Halalkalicoccus sp. NIPERK01]MDL5361104.1 MFS transporter [Halalkalicoccus sp. NIPERK01]
MSHVGRIYYGWVVVAACFLGSFVVFGLSYSFGVFFEPILEEFGRSRGVTSVAFGVQSLMLYLGAVAIGVLVDRYGTRRMLAVGTVVLGLGLAGTSQARSLPALVFTYGVVTGLGMSVLFVVSYATVPRWFDRRQGLAGGLASAGLGMGMVVVAPAADALIVRLGWRSALLVLAACSVALLVVATAAIRDEPAPEQVPDREFAGGFDASPRVDLHERLAEVRTIARSPAFLAQFVGWLLIYTTLYVVLSHLVVHIVDLGLSRTVGATAVALIGGASVVGRVAIGHAADRVGRVSTFVVCSTVMGAATITLPALDTAATLLAFAGVYGLAYGGNGALLAPLTADLFGRSNINAVFGLVSVSLGVSGLVSPYVAGAGHDAIGTYSPAFVAAGLLALVGAGAIAVAGRLSA